VVREGINAFFNFSPIERNSDEPNRIYRSFHWGKDLDLFILDGRSYRSRNDYPDTLQFNKTLLGKEQLHWLEQGLLNSKATWKIISTDVPITIPSCFRGRFSIGNGCDNWATSYDTNKTFVRERSEFLNFLDNYNIKNVIFLATDVHFAANVKVDEDPNHDGNRLLFYELTNGPLSTFAKNTTNPLDPTLHANYLYNESAIFNFGYVTIKKVDGNAHFIYHVIDTDGRIRTKSDLDITPQK
jgi:alkaline phosphatase D